MQLAVPTLHVIIGTIAGYNKVHMNPQLQDGQGAQDSPSSQHSQRSTLDVTNRVDTMDPVSVSFEVAQIYERLYCREFPSGMLRVFADIGRLYRGEFPGYHACETDYHDIQHILEVTLAMTRLMDGCAQATSTQVMDERLFQVGTVSALFHDIGYLRRLDDNEKKRGAEYPRSCRPRRRIHVLVSAGSRTGRTG